MASERQHLGMVYVHQSKLTVGECITRLKAIAESKSPAEMLDMIFFL
jgi:hypothetical protein